MTNQHEFQKVLSAVIQPVEKSYGWKMTDDQRDAWAERLAGFGESELKRAAEKVIATSKTRPTLAHILEAMPGTPPAIPQQQATHDVDRLAAEYFRSADGQQALQEGFGQSVYADLRSHGSPQKSLSAYRCAFRDAVGQAATLSDKDPAHRALLGIWNAMQDRERWLYQRYYRAQGTAA